VAVGSTHSEAEVCKFDLHTQAKPPPNPPNKQPNQPNKQASKQEHEQTRNSQSKKHSIINDATIHIQKKQGRQSGF
jgi:hypothetical protein